MRTPGLPAVFSLRAPLCYLYGMSCRCTDPPTGPMILQKANCCQAPTTVTYFAGSPRRHTLACGELRLHQLPTSFFRRRHLRLASESFDRRTDIANFGSSLPKVPCHAHKGHTRPPSYSRVSKLRYLYRRRLRKGRSDSLTARTSLLTSGLRSRAQSAYHVTANPWAGRYDPAHSRADHDIRRAGRSGGHRVPGFMVWTLH